MKSATAFCPDRLCFGDSASCYLSLWNTVAVHIFYSEHTVYFPDPLCCARSMAELCSIQKALHKGELFGVAYFLVIHLGFICFAACFCELIAAGCILKSTFNSTDFFLYLGNCESFNELWDGLKISVSACVFSFLCIHDYNIYFYIFTMFFHIFKLSFSIQKLLFTHNSVNSNDSDS